MSPRPVCWYHIWAGDDRHPSLWQRPAQEHFTALCEAEFEGTVMTGIVGGPAQCSEVTRWLTAHWPDWKYGSYALDGYEMPTIKALHEFCQKMYVHPATPVLYAHTKGSFQVFEYNHRWRRAMTGLVYRWRDCTDYLAEGYDAVGMHWLTPQEFPDLISPGKPMFGGNFWWATAGYLKGLPPVQFGSRYCAESWVGQNNPKVRDLKPGWPLEYWQEPA